MAGPTTAERGERRKAESGPPRPPLLRRLPRLRTLIILIVGVMLAGGAAAWVLYLSPWLRVEEVPVSGVDVLTEREVREAADVPVGSPLMSVDTAAIEARLRQKLPRIDSVDVVRSWPHGVALDVTERTPVLIVEDDGNDESGENDKQDGKFVEVDDDGVRFATVPKRPEGVPLLELTVSHEAGLRRFPADRLVREAVRVAGDIPAAVARDTRTLRVRSYDSIVLELSGGRTVTWGSGEKGRAKATTLTALMKASPKARDFDVSVPTAPASSGS
ncbi:cell division protein FtsQ/DivIB [Streptomyces sp. NPDC059785]|uniref:cell division protein FtsQ/DivIB n=1 Tax=Streptomyces sp. NPDC059785 TaxID=3346945 RepID=UPI0036548E75